MTKDNGTNLPPQGVRRPRGSARGEGVVPVFPVSKGHCLQDPESSDGPFGEDFEADWRIAAALLDRLIRILETREERMRGFTPPLRSCPPAFQLAEEEATTSCNLTGGLPDSGRDSPPMEEGTKTARLTSIYKTVKNIGVQTEDCVERIPTVITKQRKSRKDTYPRSWVDVVRYGGTFERGGQVTSCAKQREETTIGVKKTDPGDRCYWCRATGHTRKECPVPVNMSNRCYWCGTLGHKAAVCGARPFCWPCSTRGRQNTQHAAGGRGCPEYPPTTNEDSPNTSEGNSNSPRKRKKKRQKERIIDDWKREGHSSSPLTRGGPDVPTKSVEKDTDQKEEMMGNRGTPTSPRAEGVPDDSAHQVERIPLEEERTETESPLSEEREDPDKSLGPLTPFYMAKLKELRGKETRDLDSDECEIIKNYSEDCDICDYIGREYESNPSRKIEEFEDADKFVLLLKEMTNRGYMEKRTSMKRIFCAQGFEIPDWVNIRYELKGHLQCLLKGWRMQEEGWESRTTPKGVVKEECMDKVLSIIASTAHTWRKNKTGAGSDSVS